MDAGARAHLIARLGHAAGNQAVQRYLRQSASAGTPVVQRQPAGAPPAATSGWSFDPTQPKKPDPLDMRSAVAHVIEQGAKEQGIVFGWLDQNTVEANTWAMGIQPMDALVAKVQQQAAGADSLPADRIRRAILAWAASHNVRPQPGTQASGDVLRGRLEDAVKGALDVAADGVEVTLAERKGEAPGDATSFKVGISVQGVTAKLKANETEVGVTAAFDKGVKATLGDERVSFSAEMTPDSWSLKLNIGLDPEVPDLQKVGEVFAKGQRGLTDLIAHPEKRAQAEVTDALRATGEAFDALQGIAKVTRLSASIAAGSTDQGDAAKGGGPPMPKGWQVTVTLSGTF